MSDALQTIFNNAYIGVLKQNDFSVKEGQYPEDLECVYLSDDKKLKCGIGHSILTEFYSKELENSGVGTVIVADALAKSLGVPHEDIDDIQRELSQLQGLHDIAAQQNPSISDWCKHMDLFASENELDIPTLKGDDNVD